MVRYLDPLESVDSCDERPQVDGTDPARLIDAAVADVLDIAETWLAWDGRVIMREGNAWTPHKALRRVADHLLDHLAEIEARLAGQDTLPDRWHGRRLTLHTDLAPFTEAELDEATSRLTRLGSCFQSVLSHLEPQLLDIRPDEHTWTIREIVHHVSGVRHYAGLVGRQPP
jgi:hypothetical protein